MKKLAPIIILLFCIQSSVSQNPLVKRWDSRFGGNSWDYLNAIRQTRDGGYIIGGYSTSGINGDKTQASWGNEDFWIVKTDSTGNKLWDKRFGGTDNDELVAIDQTNDGGYILAGNSSSGIGGDKTQIAYGISDYWIVKIDSLGNKQWDNRFGGLDNDHLYSMQKTDDGGCILGGYSASGIGGDKTQPLWNNLYDYWIVKVDSLGNKQWDKDFGGMGHDYLTSLKQTIDKGYILGGFSGSGIGGDKTQDTWGSGDYWIIKIDSLGNLQWDKDFGGTGNEELYSLVQTFDNGYILGGFSNSGISGDKTQATWGGPDYWMIKIDSVGNKQWDKDFGGGNGEDNVESILQTSDGGYLIAAESYSQMSGDKSENNLGLVQSWILKTDAAGNKQWDKTIFTSPEDKVFPYVIQSTDGCYIVGQATIGTNVGDKTQPNWDITNSTSDYWIVKFCDTTATPSVAFTTSTPICPGTCTSFTNLSTNATTYQWSFPGAIPDTSTAINPQSICYNTPGSYDVTLIASNANGSDTLSLANYITVFPYPPPQGISQNGDTLFANQGAVSYQWYFNGNIISAATNYFYVAQASGDFNVVATDGNGCEVEAVIFNVIASVQAAEGSGSVQVFPNPVLDRFTIQNLIVTSGTTVEISICNMLGEKIFEKEITTSEKQLDISFLQSGIYLLRIETAGKIFDRKLVKM